jgi:hypothetical protein
VVRLEAGVVLEQDLAEKILLAQTRKLVRTAQTELMGLMGLQAQVAWAALMEPQTEEER